MRIGELSKRTGASVRSIRHYDENGLLDAGRTESGYRTFDDSAVDRVLRIKNLIYHGLTVDDILPMVECLDAPASEEQFCDHVMELYEAKLRALDGEIEALRRRHRRLAERLRQLRTRREGAERVETGMGA